MERTFTIEEARQTLANLSPIVGELIDVRSRFTIAQHATPPAPLADLKALEARLSELLDQFPRVGIQVKGWAPLLLDLPTVHEGRELLLCWLEGESELAWYHEPAHGFAGRRPLGEIAG